jgi:hypothetical protein
MGADVIVGKDGWLFLGGGSNSVMDYYTGKKIFDAHLTRKWRRLLSGRFDRLKALGADYVHLFAPNKLSVYPEYHPDSMPYFNGHPIRALMNSYGEENIRIHENIIDPIPYFTDLKKDHLLYWKTDTHWTYLGAYAAYQLICSRLQVDPLSELLDRKYGEAELALDLGSKVSPLRKEVARFYSVLEKSKRVSANPIVNYKEDNKLENEIGWHVGSNVVFRNSSSVDGRTLVLFGDSFSEYRPHLLTGLLAETFREVHFVWSVSLDYEYINNVNPDIVVTEIVERFMPSVPDDEFSLNRYTRKKMKLSRW